MISLEFQSNFLISFVFTAMFVDWPKISRHFLDQSEGGLEIKIKLWLTLRVFFPRQLAATTAL